MRALEPASATSVQEQGCVRSVMDTMIQHLAVIVTTQEDARNAGAKVHVQSAKAKDINN